MAYFPAGGVYLQMAILPIGFRQLDAHKCLMEACCFAPQNVDVEGHQLVKVGGAEGIRTLDLLDAIEARFQLRHGPTAGMEFL